MKKILLVVLLIANAILAGCAEKSSPTSATSIKSLTLVKQIDGFSTPECVVIDQTTGDMYVSNVAMSKDGNAWADDSNGFISKLDKDGNIQQIKWLQSSEAMPVHSPKGMTIMDGYLYFNDNAALKRVRLSNTSKVEIIPLEGSTNLNDLANDGTCVWTTDSDTDKVFKVNRDGSYTVIPAPENVNGITCWKGQVFAVSWDLHDLYELDADGINPPVAFGLADHFKNLDTIEVLDDGTFIVSDFKGNKLSAVSPDRKTVKTLIETTTPADIAIDHQHKQTYTPLFTVDKVQILTWQ